MTEGDSVKQAFVERPARVERGRPRVVRRMERPLEARAVAALRACCGAPYCLGLGFLLFFFFVFRARNYFGPIGLLICWVCHALFVVA